MHAVAGGQDVSLESTRREWKKGTGGGTEHAQDAPDCQDDAKPGDSVFGPRPVCGVLVRQHLLQGRVVLGADKTQGHNGQSTQGVMLRSGPTRALEGGGGQRQGPKPWAQVARKGTSGAPARRKVCQRRERHNTRVGDGGVPGTVAHDDTQPQGMRVRMLAVHIPGTCAHKKYPCLCTCTGEMHGQVLGELR